MNFMNEVGTIRTPVTFLPNANAHYIVVWQSTGDMKVKEWQRTPPARAWRNGWTQFPTSSSQEWYNGGPMRYMWDFRLDMQAGGVGVNGDLALFELDIFAPPIEDSIEIL